MPPRRLKKIKGGLNINYAKKIRDLNNPNNLKSLNNLKKEKLIQLRKIDDEEDFYFIDETGKTITDPISLQPIKYKDAFLLDNNFLYNILSLYQHFHIRNSKINPETTDRSSYDDISKIRNFFDMRTRLNSNTKQLLEDLSSFNNLKIFEDLLDNNLLKLHDGEYYFVDDKGVLIKDRVSNKPIRYKHGFLFGDYLYDINSLATFKGTQTPVLKSEFQKTTKYHDPVNEKKILRFNEHYVLLLLDPRTTRDYSKHYQYLINIEQTPHLVFSGKDFRTFRPLDILIQLGLAVEDGYLIGIDDNIIKSKKTHKNIKYSNAILLNGYELEYIDDLKVEESPYKRLKTIEPNVDHPYGGGCYNKYLKNIKELNKLKPFKELKKAGILKYIKIDENEGYLLIKCRN